MHIESKYLIEVNNSTLVHNHLNDSSFSLEDILAVVELNAFNFFPVTPNFLFKLIRPDQIWGIEINESFIELFNAAKIIAEDLLNKQITTNEISIIDAEIEKMHYIWITIFNYYGIEYTKSRL